MRTAAAYRRVAQWTILLAAILFTFAPSLLIAAEAKAGQGASNESSAERMVADALRAEVDGNLAKRRVLLSVAVDQEPEYAPARWQSGQVRVDGEWQTVGEAQVAAAKDPRRIEYQVLRKSAGDSFGEQLQLARWCDQQKLAEEAAFHWSSVLAYQPNNPEALRATDSCWYQGQRMTRAEATAAKQQARARKEAARKYKPTVTRWNRMLAAGDIHSRDAALEEIRTNRDLSAIPALEAVTLDARLENNATFERTLQIGLAFVAALGEQPGQAATDSLLRH
ncbi:MAG: hypothetical protein AB7U97_25010, partial [Pirellulales bacterium]